eukprot:scaffold803_cov310-Pinguiococcus_pyrenoidosus.AAC.2
MISTGFQQADDNVIKLLSSLGFPGSLIRSGVSALCFAVLTRWTRRPCAGHGSSPSRSSWRSIMSYP